MAWWVNIAPEVIHGVQSFEAGDPLQILETVEHFLSLHGEACASDRWQACPEKFFVYTHVFTVGGRLHTLEFLVEDTSKAVGVLRVVWVEHFPGEPFP